MSQTTATTRSEQLLAQADVLLLVRDMLIQPIASGPVIGHLDEQSLRNLFERAGLSGAEVHARAVHPLWESVVTSGGAELAQAHCDLFEGAVPCPVTETAYIRRDKGAILADVAGFYRAFGFEIGTLGEKLDHLAVELEFVAVLLIMQAQARSEGNAQYAEVAASALKSFARDHLGEWILSFCHRLAGASALPMHHCCATLLGDGWRAIIEANGLEAPSCAEPITAGEDEAGPYECGMVEQPVALTADRMPLPPTLAKPALDSDARRC